MNTHRCEVQSQLRLLAVSIALSFPMAQVAKPPGDAAAPAAPASMAERPLGPAQLELLDLAFSIASKPPSDPHIKTRCRLQESVVATCLELGQPQRAERCLAQIDDWRRGACLADLANYYAEHAEADAKDGAAHVVDLADKLLADAAELAAAPVDDNSQDWQRERVRAKIARAFLLLGRPEDAARFAAGVTDAEAGPLAVANARLLDAAKFDQQLAALDPVLANGSFEQQRNALEMCARFFDRFYADEPRRSAAESKIRAAWKKLPLQVHFDLMHELAESALAHADPKKARELADELQKVLDAGNLTPDFSIPLVARLATIRFRAGDAVRAKADDDAALASYFAAGARIVDIDRADALVPLAESYLALGAGDAATTVYRLAVDASVANPNSRPRAEDLCAICRSMAAHAFSPDAELLARLRRLHAELGSPW